MTIPCKDCLVFPMCKNKYTSSHLGCSYVMSNKMISDCSLFSNWYTKYSIPYQKKVYIKKEVIKTYEVEVMA